MLGDSKLRAQRELSEGHFAAIGGGCIKMKMFERRGLLGGVALRTPPPQSASLRPTKRERGSEGP